MRPTGEDIELRLLLDAIFERYHYDFRSYSEASLKRRVSAALGHFGCKTLSRLQERVLHEPRVFSELLRFLTAATCVARHRRRAEGQRDEADRYLQPAGPMRHGRCSQSKKTPSASEATGMVVTALSIVAAP